MRIYLDTAPIIYLVENVSPYIDKLITRLAVPDTSQVCGQLSRLECRVKPLREQDQLLINAYDSYFNHVAAEILPLSPDVIDQATQLRAQYNFHTPDALHLATAIVYQCDLFLTNDRQLRQCQQITVEIVG